QRQPPPVQPQQRHLGRLALRRLRESHRREPAPAGRGRVQAVPASGKAAQEADR
ncbi:MAG: hypothetical protein QOJ50_870, partial [Cryptosporangiaceae bacterium]|nr:hypothetical protein [Cryptosporangiaceae bacterium]